MALRVPEMPYTRQLISLLDAIEGRPADALAQLAALPSTAFDGHITFHLSESYAMAGETATAPHGRRRG